LSYYLKEILFSIQAVGGVYDTRNSPLEHGDLAPSLGNLVYKVIRRGNIDSVNRSRCTFFLPHQAPFGACLVFIPYRNRPVIYSAIPLLRISSKARLIELHCPLGLICADIEMGNSEHSAPSITYSYSRVSVVSG
jgi:hypothetical protein